MSETIRVEVRKGHFNWSAPDVEEINVYICIPGFEALNLGLPLDQGEYLKSGNLRWSYVIQEATTRWLELIWFSIQKEKVKRLAQWIGQDSNADLCDQAWAAHELPKLEAEIAALEAQRRILMELCSAQAGVV